MTFVCLGIFVVVVCCTADFQLQYIKHFCSINKFIKKKKLLFLLLIES